MDEPQPHDNKQDRLPRRKIVGTRRRFIFSLVFLLILILFLLLILHACSRSQKKPKPPVPIVAATACTADVPVYVSALGTVTATYTVTVKTQVAGILERVLFQEGQMVRIGDLLEEIDQRPFLAQLQQYQGQLERDVAQLNNARVDLKRYQKLYPAGAISQQILATQEALVKQLEGTVEFDQGQIQTVKVNLVYTHIISPINGRVGLRLVDAGNYVQPSDTTGLVVVNTVQPITVIFAVPEDDIRSILASPLNTKPLPVLAYDRTQHNLLGEGKLLTIDNQINTTTGTVNVRAEFQNRNLQLFPNQFVNVDLLVNTLPQAVVVPTAAIQRGQNGTFIYLINANKTVSVKPVITSVVYGENTVISSGVSSGQQVVIEGADQLSDGAKVSFGAA